MPQPIGVENQAGAHGELTERRRGQSDLIGQEEHPKKGRGSARGEGGARCEGWVGEGPGLLQFWEQLQVLPAPLQLSWSLSRPWKGL